MRYEDEYYEDEYYEDRHSVIRSFLLIVFGAACVWFIFISSRGTEDLSVNATQGRGTGGWTTDNPEIASPYIGDFVITQGLHGFSYGHAAIDIACGKGCPIYAPISGEITTLTIDEWGNTVIVIENDYYSVEMLHGDYEAYLGERVQIGQRIGSEGNNGYVMDMQGNLCYGRECGYHTHLNIYSKEAARNVDPIALLGLKENESQD